jgi:hypothetical protein
MHHVGKPCNQYCNVILTILNVRVGKKDGCYVRRRNSGGGSSGEKKSRLGAK